MKSAGQSLISILVAVFILVVLALIVSGMAILAIRLATEGERRIVALGIANEELEYARSQLYKDLAPRLSGTITRNGQQYEVITSLGGGESPGEYSVASVKVLWTASNGRQQDVEAATYIVNASLPLDCGTCPFGTCDPTIGFCLPSVGVPGGSIAGDCEPGLLCEEDGSVCPIDRSCPGHGATDEGFPPQPACWPGETCANGTPCQLNGKCPSKICEAGDLCFNGYAYDLSWYSLSFPASDVSGPGSSVPSQCKEEGCTSSSACPATCKIGTENAAVIWQCEKGWHPMCPSVGGDSGEACFGGGYDENGLCTGTVSIPVACPNPESPDKQYCSNGYECSQSDIALPCPGSPLGSINWGGYGTGCRPYEIDGVLASVRDELSFCPGVGGGLPEVTLELINPDGDDSDYVVMEGDDGGTLDFKVRVLGELEGDLMLLLEGEDVSANQVDDDYTLLKKVVIFKPEDVQFDDGNPFYEEAVPVLIHGDSKPEGHEEFKVKIVRSRSNAHAIVDATASIVVKIVNDDVELTIDDYGGFGEGDINPDENTLVTFNVSLLGATSGTALTAPITVNVHVSNGGGDYESKAEDMVFDPQNSSSSSQSFQFTAWADTAVELDEEADVTLSGANVFVSKDKGNFTIYNDDGAYAWVNGDSFNEADAEFDGFGFMEFSIGLSEATTEAMTGEICTRELPEESELDRATEGEDYLQNCDDVFFEVGDFGSSDLEVVIVYNEGLPGDDDYAEYFEAVLEFIGGPYFVSDDTDEAVIYDKQTPNPSLFSDHGEGCFADDGCTIPEFGPVLCCMNDDSLFPGQCHYTDIAHGGGCGGAAIEPGTREHDDPCDGTSDCSSDPETLCCAVGGSVAGECHNEIFLGLTHGFDNSCGP